MYIDSDISMKTHVSQTVSSCSASLRHIRSICRSVSKPVLMSLVSAMVLARLDYGSVTLNGITTRLMNCLQMVLNAAASLVCNSHKYDRTSPLLRDLHWLCVPERVVMPLCSTAAARQHLNSCRDNYIGSSMTNRDDHCGQRRLRD